MRRDKMIGLALAIILVGFTAAFCLRNERTELFQGPKLKNPQALDADIAGKDGPKPYGDEAGRKNAGQSSRLSSGSASGVKLQGVEVGDHSRPAAGQQSLDRQNPAGQLPNFLREETVPAPRSDFARKASPPAPIPAWNSQVPAPRHNRDWVPVTPESEARNVGRESMLRHPLRMHQVRKGDTLSELAVRYLGGSARFMEIYEANRDILRSPDDLPVGMKIAIPQRRSIQRASNPRRPAGSRQTPTSANSRYQSRSNGTLGSETRGVSHERLDAVDHGLNSIHRYNSMWHGTTPGQPVSPSGRFLPVRHSPFSRGARLDDSTPPVRKLTQSPPADLPSLFDDPFFPEGN